jgi:type II secretory pathway component GspD/PulD (secretin)
MELLVEASEIEEDNRGLDANTAGFITSKREVETSALVADNQTVVLGGLMGSTETNVETKVPILGDLPLIGTFFRGSRTQARRTNLMIFLTPHIIDDNEDIAEVMAVKEAQRQEFLRRFYGKTQEQQAQELERLLRFSMNQVGEESEWRDPAMKNANRRGWEDEAESRAMRDAVEEGIEDAERELGDFEDLDEVEE